MILMFSCASCFSDLDFSFFIPCYTVIWLIVASLAPYRSNLGGIRVSICFSMPFIAPSFASLSLSLFFSVSLWPFVQVKVIFANVCFRRYAATLKIQAFCTRIHPWSSHLCRCSVSLTLPLTKVVCINVIFPPSQVQIILTGSSTLNKADITSLAIQHIFKLFKLFKKHLNIILFNYAVCMDIRVSYVPHLQPIKLLTVHTLSQFCLSQMNIHSHYAICADTELLLPFTDTSVFVCLDLPNYPLIYNKFHLPLQPYLKVYYNAYDTSCQPMLFKHQTSLNNMWK